MYKATIAICLLLTVSVSASEIQVKGSLIHGGKATVMKYGYAWVESDSSLKLLFCEKPQNEPKVSSTIKPTALEIHAQLTKPDFVSYGTYLIMEAGALSLMSNADRIVLTSFDRVKVEGRIYHHTAEESWDIHFSLPLLNEKLNAPLLGDPLPAGANDVALTFQSYLKALKSGDTGEIRKFTTRDFGKNFSRPEMRMRIVELKPTFRDDIEIISGFSNGSVATLFVMPKGSKNGAEMGTAKLVLVNNEWKVSADIFTKFY